MNSQQEDKDSVNFNFNCPNDRVGLIIGKKGSTFHQIQNDSGSKIIIPKDCPPGTSHRIITLRGRPVPENNAQPRRHLPTSREDPDGRCPGPLPLRGPPHPTSVFSSRWHSCVFIFMLTCTIFGMTSYTLTIAGRIRTHGATP